MMILDSSPTAVVELLIIGVELMVLLGVISGAIKRSLKKPNNRMNTAKKPIPNPKRRDLVCCWRFNCRPSLATGINRWRRSDRVLNGGILLMLGGTTVWGGPRGKAWGPAFGPNLCADPGKGR